LLIALPASAAPQVAVHPLEVEGDNAAANEDSRSEFLSEAARQAIEMVSRSEVEVSLAHYKGTCLRHDGCLEKLAAETGSTYALFATLDLRGVKFKMTAQIVASDGTVVKKIDALSTEKDLLSARAPQVKALFRQLFGMLELGALPAVLPKKAEPVVVAPVPAPVPVEPPAVVIAPVRAAPSSTNGLRIGGIVVGAAGVVATAVGAGLLGIGASQAGALPASGHGATNYFANNDDAHAAAAANSQATIGTAVLSAGGVAIAAGVVMVLLSADSAPSVVAVPINGGAVVTMGGHF
jgi:hypothetical protein